MAGNQGTTRSKPRASSQGDAEDSSSNGRGVVSRVGPLEIDWPRSVGYFGGIGAAVCLGILDPPVGLFIAAIPFIKMLDLPRGPRPGRLLSQVIQGVAKPVGGDSQGTIRLVTAREGASGASVAQD